MITRIRSGDTYSFRYSHPNYGVGDWTLKYYLSGKTSVSVDGNVDGDEWVITLNATQTSLLSPGLYIETLRVTNSVETYTVASSNVKVMADPSTATPPAMVAERMLELIDKALLNQLSEEEAIESFSVGGRTLQFLSRSELIEERNFWSMELARHLRISPIRGIRLTANRIF